MTEFPIVSQLAQLDERWREIAIQTGRHNHRWEFHVPEHEEAAFHRLTVTGEIAVVQSRRDGRPILLASAVPARLRKKFAKEDAPPQSRAKIET
jgi:hypothetical protein